jgi:hypothetical protein
MAPKPKRTPTRRPTEAVQRKSNPRQPKPPEPPVEAVSPAPLPTPAPSVPPVATSRWTVGTALVVVLVALTAALAVIGAVRLLGDDGFQLDSGVPTAASAADLRGYATDSRPVYWIGPAQKGTLEVTRTSRGIYVRYLPDGVALGDKSPRYTTIATYPLKGAYESMQRSARSGGFGSARLDGGGLAAWRKSPGTSVYVAYPRRPYLIEVYDPSPRRARSLALSGVVQRAP